MINNLINSLEDAIDMHEEYMMFAHSLGLQGLKRFNRYETIENLKRVHKLKNYMLEFGMGEYSRDITNIDKPNSYINLIQMIIRNRESMIDMLESEYASTSDLCYGEMINEIYTDFKKELEVFSRIYVRLGYLVSEDSKKMVLFEWDNEMHEYMKKKED